MDEKDNEVKVETATEHELWKKIEENFGDEDLHRQYVDWCWKSGNYLDGTANYRKWLEEYPGDEIAKKYLNQLLLISQYTYLKVEDKEEGGDPAKNLKNDTLILGLLVGCLIFLALAISQGWLSFLLPKVDPRMLSFGVITVFGILVAFIIVKLVAVFARSLKE